MPTPQWVMLVYRLPRTPSTPRITLWRRLRRLGAAQLVDGVVALPETARNREQLEWLAEEVVDAGGTATIWTAAPTTAAQHRALAASMTERVEQEYRQIAEAARRALLDAPVEQRRALARLRRGLRRVDARDYFGAGGRAHALDALDVLARASAGAAA